MTRVRLSVSRVKRSYVSIWIYIKRDLHSTKLLNPQKSSINSVEFFLGFLLYFMIDLDMNLLVKFF